MGGLNAWVNDNDVSLKVPRTSKQPQYDYLAQENSLKEYDMYASFLNRHKPDFSPGQKLAFAVLDDALFILREAGGSAHRRSEYRAARAWVERHGMTRCGTMLVGLSFDYVCDVLHIRSNDGLRQRILAQYPAIRRQRAALLSAPHVAAAPVRVCETPGEPPPCLAVV